MEVLTNKIITMSKLQYPATVPGILNGQVLQLIVITDKFAFYCDPQEGDDNGNTKMFDKTDMRLISDNYFASVGLLDVVLDSDPIEYASPLWSLYRSGISEWFTF